MYLDLWLRSKSLLFLKKIIVPSLNLAVLLRFISNVGVKDEYTLTTLQYECNIFTMYISMCDFIYAVYHLSQRVQNHFEKQYRYTK